MSRLVHSEGGFIRSTQISKKEIFAYVEGGMDRPFYSKIMQNLLGEKVSFRVVSAKELPGNTGGKNRLLRWFRSLRRRELLSSEVFGKKTINIIFADKDVDDLTRKKLRSPHLIYTPTYDLEGHLMEQGNLSLAISDACGVTLGHVYECFGRINDWLVKQVENWADWNVLCILSEKLKINVGCTFNRASVVNEDLLGPCNPADLSRFRAGLAAGANISLANLDKKFNQLRNRFIKDLKAGFSFKYFKGKWMKSVLQKFAETKLLVPDALVNGMGDRVISCLVAQVGTSAKCKICSFYEEPFRLLRL